VRFLILTEPDQPVAPDVLEALKARFTDHEVVCDGLASTLPSGDWDAVLVTPGSDGLSADFREALAKSGTFSVEVQPENTNGHSPDHHPTGTDAILLGTGASGYAHAMAAFILRSAA
jgi:hypothetical protein